MIDKGKTFDKTQHPFIIKTLQKVSVEGSCYYLVAKLCLFCYPMDCSPPGSSFLWISQASILEWVAISFSRGSPKHNKAHINSQLTSYFIVRKLNISSKIRNKIGCPLLLLLCCIVFEVIPTVIREEMEI